MQKYTTYNNNYMHQLTNVNFQNKETKILI